MKINIELKKTIKCSTVLEWVKKVNTNRSSRPEVFLRTGVLKMYLKFRLLKTSGRCDLICSGVVITNIVF